MFSNSHINRHCQPQVVTSPQKLLPGALTVTIRSLSTFILHAVLNALVREVVQRSIAWAAGQDWSAWLHRLVSLLGP